MPSDFMNDDQAKLLSNRDFSSTVNNYNLDSADQSDADMLPIGNGAMMKSKNKESSLDNVNKGNIGLWSVRAMLFVFLWYFFSALTLFLNKYILATMHGDPVLLSK